LIPQWQRGVFKTNFWACRKIRALPTLAISSVRAYRKECAKMFFM
jgi:hypothetical protein